VRESKREENCGDFYSVPLNICRIALLLLRQRRGAADNGPGNSGQYLKNNN
jgi:hypothetical protein